MVGVLGIRDMGDLVSMSKDQAPPQEIERRSLSNHDVAIRGQDADTDWHPTPETEETESQAAWDCARPQAML